jgi:peptidylprolyl isomerase
MGQRVPLRIGAEVRVDPELRELYVVSTVFDGPADRVGIKPNDAILSINGTGDLAGRGTRPMQFTGSLKAPGFKPFNPEPVM